jgi:hypothetical protein
MNWRTSRACCLVIVGGIFSACSGDIAAPGPGGIRPETDPSRAAFALVGPEGGAIEARSAAGVTYRLVVPAAALREPVRITLTPVNSIAGLPLDKELLGAVEFQPDGLRLASPASLTITTTHAFDRRELAAFGYRAQGDDFHLRPSADTGNAITLPVSHFSTDGAALATEQNVAAVVATPPRLAEDRLEQRAAQLIGASRRSGAPLDNTALAAAYREYYQTTLRPEMTTAAQSATFEVASDIFARAIAWLRTVQLLGLESASTGAAQEINGFLGSALSRFFTEGSTACLQQHRLEQVPRLIGLARQGQLLLNLDLPVVDVMTRCMQFVLEVSIETEVSGFYDHVIRIVATIPLKMGESLSPSLSGSAVPSTATWSMAAKQPPPGCVVASVGPHAPPALRVPAMSLVLPKDGAGPPVDVTLTYNMAGSWVGDFTMTCLNAPPITQQVPIPWFNYGPEVSEHGGWEMLGGSLYARWVRDVTGSQNHTRITLGLYHTPAP